MARTQYFMQFSNPGLSISGGSGTTGTTGSPSAGSLSDLVAKLALGYDVYVNRGGIAAPDLGGGQAANSVLTTWFTMSAAPTNLGRLLLWDGYLNNGLGLEPWTVDAGFYDATATSGTGGWTSIGSGRWTKTFTFTGDPVLRTIFAQAVRGVGLDTTTRLELRQRSSAVNCTTVGDWYQAAYDAGTTSVTVTMYTGGNADADSPARMMGGLALVGSQSRFVRAVRFTTGKRLEFDPIQVVHGSMQWIASTTADVSEDIVLNDLRCFGAAINGIRIGSIASATDHTAGVFRVRFNSPIITTGTRAEASAADYATVQNWHALQHNVSIWGQVGEVSFVNPTLFGARHGCIELQSDTGVGANTGYPRNIEFYGTTQGDASIDFPRNDPNGYYNPFGVATSGSVTIRNFIIQGANKSAGAGGHARIEGNHWKNFGYCLAPAGSDDNGGIDDVIMFPLGTSNGSSAAYDIGTCSIDFCNNIIENPWNYIMRIPHQFDGLVPAHSLRITGNTFVDLEHFYERKIYTQSTSGKTRSELTASASASIFVSNQSTSGTPGLYMTPQTLMDNVFITPTASVIASSVFGSSSAGTIVSGDTVADGTDVDSEIVRTGNQHFTSVATAGLGATFVPGASSALVGAASNTTPRIDFAGKVRAMPAAVGAKEPA